MNFYWGRGNGIGKGSQFPITVLIEHTNNAALRERSCEVSWKKASILTQTKLVNLLPLTSSTIKSNPSPAQVQPVNSQLLSFVQYVKRPDFPKILLSSPLEPPNVENVDANYPS